jgi:zinc/manganese transport system substrate-binding protein
MRVVLGILIVVTLGACSGDDEAATAGTQVVVTSSILGDIVEQVAGGDVDVEVVMPRGADPHEFAPSARQVEAMAEADLLVVNGGGFEAGLLGAIDAAEDAGATVFTATDHVELRGDDPHIWTDPTNMIAVVEALDEVLPGSATGYLDELRTLDAEIEETLAPVERRVLVTNHEVLGYFAERYGFDVVGTVIPSLSTRAEASAADVEDLAEIILAEDVPAIFVETSSSADLAEALADDVGDVEVVELFAESLGEPGSGGETYVEMQRTNAERIAEGLRP